MTSTSTAPPELAGTGAELHRLAVRLSELETEAAARKEAFRPPTLQERQTFALEAAARELAGLRRASQMRAEIDAAAFAAGAAILAGVVFLVVARRMGWIES